MLLAGCAALGSEIDAMRGGSESSGPSLASQVEAQIPGSTVDTLSNKNGFAQDLTVIVAIPTEDAIAPETAVAGLKAVCASAGKYEFVTFMVVVDTEDSPKVDLAPLLGPTYPEFVESPQLSAYVSMKKLCAS